jgi:release factor glutamine methyltransferase
MKIRQALIWGAKNFKKSKSSALDAEVLLVFVLKKDEAWLFSHLDGDLTSNKINKYQKLISCRKKGKPIAYIVHHKEFYGLDFYVNKSVLIPRPETELLVDEALKFGKKKMKILDVGTGSGCIIIALAVNSKPLTNNKYYATDISQKVLKIAQKNAKKHNIEIHFIKSNLFKNISKNLKFDLIVANLPYLQKQDIKGEIIYEPKRALLGGEEGVAIIKRFLLGSKNYLAKNGKIIIEIDPRQAKTIKNMAKNIYPDKKVLLKQDLSKFDRMMILR